MKVFFLCRVAIVWVSSCCFVLRFYFHVTEEWMHLDQSNLFAFLQKYDILWAVCHGMNPLYIQMSCYAAAVMLLAINSRKYYIESFDKKRFLLDLPFVYLILTMLMILIELDDT